MTHDLHFTVFNENKDTKHTVVLQWWEKQVGTDTYKIATQTEVPIEAIVPPRAAADHPNIPLETYEGMWRVKFGESWVQDAGYGERCISDPFYLAAATALYTAGKLDRQWLAGTDRYAYRLRHADR